MPGRPLQKGNAVTGLQPRPDYKPGMKRNQPTHLVLHYRPSQPTGWEAPMPGEQGKTIGGHTPSKQFKLGRRRYRIELTPFGAPASSTDPVYEAEPSDPAVAFKRTLEAKFGAYYSFRYRGGLKGTDELKVQCYSVFAQPAAATFGAELYVVYNPRASRGDRPADPALGWIQVAHWAGTGASSPAPYVDDGGRANPFFATGGLTSIFGTQVFNFDNLITGQAQQGSGSGAALSATYTAEAFLARDTATKDAADKDVIEIFAGLKYGWQLREVTR
jgi:hypothetical protein